MDSPQPGQPPVRVQLIKLDMINAVAVPGARVLVFDGLVQQARSPDELAGVIGHEIGHVRKRHVMQAMLREFGLSALLSQSKSALGNTLGQLTALRYSRQAEGEADLDVVAIAAVPGKYEGQDDRVPAGRVGTPRELAWAATYLCSPYASYISGHSLVVDGANWQRRPTVQPAFTPIRAQLGRGPFGEPAPRP